MADTTTAPSITTCLNTLCDAALQDADDHGWTAILGLDGHIRLQCPRCTVLAGGPAETEPGSPVRLHPNETALIAVLRSAQRRRLRHLNLKAQRRGARANDTQLQARIDESGADLTDRVNRATQVLQHIISNPPRQTS